ncbi:hypothetical protein L1F30_09615 [Simiduia sp. 21SJ11W-1]|uniref:hypothetical protein n=1 Tax=Simiduia sp. 21SJ11W-1 TaxID=2909669 RepID=UPI0020A13A78|nr:hypothetical protein [Simiduia sp. 21SJ11W-1]UTA46431.1 hypothetical protein L1F30_09615 [Simiduia sp. 21SJ11W-1]
MKFILAIRAKNTQAARQLLAGAQCDVIKSRFESQDPALRNLVDGCFARGLPVEREGAGLHWFLVASAGRPAASWLQEAGVEVCFVADWLRQQALQIRYLKGVAYCDAAAAWADFLPWLNHAPLREQAGEGISWAGAPLVAPVGPADGEQCQAHPSKPVQPESLPPAAKADSQAESQTEPQTEPQAEPAPVAVNPKPRAKKIIVKKARATPALQPVTEGERKPESAAGHIQSGQRLVRTPKIERPQTPPADAESAAEQSINVQPATENAAAQPLPAAQREEALPPKPRKKIPAEKSAQFKEAGAQKVNPVPMSLPLEDASVAVAASTKVALRAPKRRRAPVDEEQLDLFG